MKSLMHSIHKTPARNHWKKVGVHSHHGIVIFLPALRSESTLSIGEYRDLIPMINWCADLGLDILQLLPVNDSGLDKSPYNGLSAFALNPAYLTLPEPRTTKQRNILQELKRLKKGKYFNYIKNYELKHQYLRLHVERSEIDDVSLDQFIDNNPWLVGYSYFKTLKIQRKWSSWQGWKETIDGSITLDDIPVRYLKSVRFHCYVQYLCHEQMKSVKVHAESRGIVIKGDIPILISPESADVWLHREMFNLRDSAGAPPDRYSTKGQYWGFPTFNWKDHEGSLLDWWTSRLRYAENYFHLYRIDHVVGLFRMWTIPRGEHSLLGKFVPDSRKEWMAQGKKILKYFLKSSLMLPIAEDLGLVPEEVKACIRALGIPGTKVMRWEKTEGGIFIDPHKYPSISMTTLSTHDSETFINWWKQYPKEAQPVAEWFGWQYRTNLSKEKNKELIHLSHHSHSLFHINLLQDYFPCIPEFSWSGSRGDRINIPGKIGDRNWRYRYRPSVEEIVTSVSLSRLIKQSIK
jgi:4-alpha-glucanotransferase